jgi:hypothetical protein
MTADGPIDTITKWNAATPIEYFESLKTKYKEDKNSKKIRYSAFLQFG